MRTEECEQNKSAQPKNANKGNKRELSSPVQQDLQVKKCRSKPGSNSDSIFELDETLTEFSDSATDMAETEIEAEATKQDDVQTYFVSRPLIPDDVYKIAQELKLLMLPEVRATVKGEIKEEMAGFGSMLEIALDKINKTLTHEIETLKTENNTLKSKVLKLENQSISYEKRALKAEKAIDTQEQYSRRNSVRISGLKEPQEPLRGCQLLKSNTCIILPV